MPKPRNKHAGKGKGAETLRVAAYDASPGAARHTGSLVVIQGAEVDLGRHLVCDHPITIGRDEGADLSLNDGSISRAHCSVERDAGGRYVLVDLGSTNGTLVNGQRVSGQIPLMSGDKIFLGASVIRFSLADAVDVEFQNRLEELVSTDPLTGLPSKRQYDAFFHAIGERAVAEATAVSLVMMDMDGLKAINDTHGHEMGSFAIAEVAGLIHEAFAAYGPLCRFGGDEFVACLPGHEREAAVALATELCRKVGAHRFQRDGVVIAPTLSLGVASFPADVGDPGALFAAADQAMYRAKRAGKNRVAT